MVIIKVVSLISSMLKLVTMLIITQRLLGKPVFNLVFEELSPIFAMIR